MKRIVLITLMVIMLFTLAGCQKKEGMKDGYYTAQAENFSHGWREFVTIMVKQDKIISVEYNAENESGFIKSWDNAYMKIMNASNGTYPNEYTRNYAAQMLEKQNAKDIDAISGATTSWKSFNILAEAAVKQAIAGDSSLLVVKTE